MTPRLIVYSIVRTHCRAIEAGNAAGIVDQAVSQFYAPCLAYAFALTATGAAVGVYFDVENRTLGASS